MEIKVADKLKDFPVYLFDQLDQAKAAMEASGANVIDLSVGDPDKGAPDHVVQALCETAKDPANHHYPSYKGMPEFRKAVADWYQSTFNVTLDPDSEVLLTIGSKGGLAHLPAALVNPGEVVLLPDPCYPAYKPGIILAGGEIYLMPLLEKNQYFPDFDAVPEQIAERAKLMVLNYPNNPTAAVASVEFFAKVVQFAEKYNVVVAHDAPYGQASFDNYRSPSFLEAPGAREVGIEFNSLSKTYNMTGWRIAYAVGNKTVLAALGKVKSNVDMGVFRPIQYAAIAALSGSQECVQEMRRLYQSRRDLLVAGLRKLGWTVEAPKASFFVWLPVPDKSKTSAEFATEVLNKAHVVITPGNGFGDSGEGYVRIALTVDESLLSETLQRLERAGFKY